MKHSETINRYLETISATRRGLRVLIADDFIVEQIAFLETVRHYLPESVADAVDSSGLEQLLDRTGSGYDLVILEDCFLLDPEKFYIKRTRNRYPDAKIALFMDRENLYRLQTNPQLSDFDIILTKCSTVEAIAEKICLTFQETH